jgi:uroporphyrin-III C-methyltransferase/precorrin-2 dehydrogenase/sirohydrochlorin ferrochelatase
MLPVFLNLFGRRVLVVGGGPVAAAKIAQLIAAGAVASDIRLVAPDVVEDIARSGVVIDRRPFVSTDLDGAWLVVAAGPPEVNREVARAAEARQVFVNAVDDPANASAYLGGVVRRAGVTVAISTDGAAPALAGLLREALAAVLPEDLEAWVHAAQRARAQWRARGVPIEERRRLLLEALNRLYRDKQESECATTS